MAFNITLYSGETKRRNSTKLPTGSATQYQGVLKEGCSVLRPVVLIDAPTLAGCNYGYINIWGKYYFVDDVVSVNRLWEVHMHVDPLATYRDQIAALSVYALRASAEYDGDLLDMIYPGKTVQDITDIQIPTTYYNIAPSAGMFVLGVINSTGSGQAGGAVTYYGLTPAQMSNVMDYLLSSAFLTDNGFSSTMTPLQQLSQDVAKCIVKPMDYIVSCMWFPNTLSGTAASFTLGYWNTGSNTFPAIKLTAFAYTETFSVSIPVHPQANLRGNYLNHAPFTELAIRIPPFGVIPLSPDYITATGALSGSIYVDTITGKAQLRVSIDGHIAAEETAMFAVPIQLSQITPDWLNTLTGVAAGAAALYAGNIGGAASIGNALENASPIPKTAGVNGSFLTEIIRPYLTVKHTVMVENRPLDFGQPLCKNKLVSELAGYIKCGFAPDTIPGTAEEKQQIQTYMMEGFYYE